MKKNFWLLVLLLVTAALAVGCAEMTGVPQGSRLLSVFKGSFNGIWNEGSVEVRLYQSPDGGKPFTGNFGEDVNYLIFSGEMKEDELQGQILTPNAGSIYGKLSADGESLSGTYKITLSPFDHGTWHAQKQ